jgi:hypothetical protein
MTEMTPMKRLVSLVALVALLMLASVAWAGSSTNFTLSPEVLAAGGQPAASSGYRLASTVGQPFVGLSSGTGAAACSGYWCRFLAEHKIMLPLVLRNY